jgi:hypothetical protein
MRLRLLVNALVAALAASVPVVFLFALLNPALAVGAGALIGLTLALVPVMTMVLALPGAGAYLLYGYFAPHPLPRRWLHWRFWGWFFVLDSALVVGVYAFNARFYRHLMDPGALERVVQGGAAVLAATLAVAAAVAAKAVARHRWARAAALAIVWGSWGLLAGLAITPGPEPEAGAPVELEALASRRPVRVIGIDGLSRDVLLPLVSEGRLPAFARLMKEGAFGVLRSFPPGDEVTLWSTVATGKKPHRHGVRGPQRYHLVGRSEPLALPPRGIGFGALLGMGLVRPEPTGPGDLRARTLWQLLSDFNVPSVFVGFPLLDERLRLPAVELRRARPGAGVPAERMQEWLARLVQPASPPDPAQEPILSAGVSADLLALEEAKRPLEGGAAAQVVAVRLSGFDHVLHHFMRYHRPGEFGNVSPALLERYGQSVAEYSLLLDEQVANAMEEVRGKGLLLVVSPHGTVPVSLAGRLAQHLRGGPPLSGEHRSGPAGVFFLYGAGVLPGQRLEAAHLPDLLPTLLYFLGLPVARDLDGQPLTQAFEPAFLGAHPISTIASYETASVRERGPESLAEPEPFPPYADSPRD